MSKQYAVIGLGKFGFSVATTLAQAGKEVLAVDKDAEPVQEIADLVTYAARVEHPRHPAGKRGGRAARHRKVHEPDACQYFEKSRRGPRRDGGE